MAYDEGQKLAGRTHNVIMEGRSKLSVSGVEEVASFDECEIIMYTCQGNLVIRGSDLHIGKLSLDSGDLNVDGSISELCYEEPRRSGGLFARLIK